MAGGSPDSGAADGITVAVTTVAPGLNSPIPQPGQVPQPFASSAVGAVRFPATAGSTATLTLTITSSSLGNTTANQQTGALLAACLITDPGWKPVQNGSFASRPTYDCNGVANVGVLNADATKVTFTLGPLFQLPTGLVDVAIVGQANGPLTARLAAPTTDDVSEQAGDDPFATDPEPSVDPVPFDDGSGTVVDEPTTVIGTPEVPVDGGTVLPFDPGPTDGGAAVITDAPSPSPDVVTGPTVPSRPEVAAGQPRRPRLTAATKPADRARFLFLVVLAGLVGALGWSTTKTVRAPAFIGPLRRSDSADPPPPPAPDQREAGVAGRGVGRHIRLRVGSPRALR